MSFDNKRILYNAIKTPDGTILHSKHRHDYVTYIDKNGYEYMIDGGTDYLRRNRVDEAPYDELTVYDDGKHETHRTFVTWGKNYDENMKRLPETIFAPIKELETEHIKAILKTQTQISDFYKEVFEAELRYRKI